MHAHVLNSIYKRLIHKRGHKVAVAHCENLNVRTDAHHVKTVRAHLKHSIAFFLNAACASLLSA